jgi:histidinol dehydrogenase
MTMRILKLSELSESQIRSILERSKGEFQKVIPQVREIMEDVRLHGDEALRRLTQQFDKVLLTEISVTAEELTVAYRQVDHSLVAALKHAIRNLEAFHRTQLVDEEMVLIDEGIRVGRVNRAIEKVGFYIPGGRHIYPSSVIMNGVPSRIAGCRERVICVPPAPDGSVPAPTLVAADLVGIRRVFKVGGAQAIAAMTYGTETIPRVFKIFGAGNIYVTAAKMLAFGEVNIDLPAGPTEVFIIADDTANPRFVAADLLSQAEHGENSACILITTSESLADAVSEEVERQLVGLATRDDAAKAIRQYGVALLADDIEACIEFANTYAPEHLEVMTSDNWGVLERITHTGSMFLGPYSPEPAGDYASGANHVLPTGSYARMFSPLSVDAFVRKVQVQELTKEGLARIRRAVSILADAEGFAAHKNAVEVRFEE